MDELRPGSDESVAEKVFDLILLVLVSTAYLTAVAVQAVVVVALLVLVVGAVS